jgi:signal transduction histidine kinase
VPWYRRPGVALCFDLALAAFVCGPLQLALIHRAPHGAVVPAVALLTAAGALLVVRRRLPVVSFAGILVAALGVRLCGYSLQPIPLLVALATLAAYRDRRTSLAAAALVAAVNVAWLDQAGPWLPIHSVYQVVVVAGAWAVGDAFRSRRGELEALRERADRAERERAQAEARAVAEEQARIARELHDVIAHNVSVIVVQAAAADDVFDVNPARAREALRSIEATGREAMGELRRLLGGVRAADESYRPQPGLGRLDELVEQVRAGGLTVTVRVDGTPRPLAPGVDLSAFRIVQEALTNTLRHAAASRADVTVRYGPEAIDLEVRDDGIGGGAQVRDGSGHGLLGMRERAALTGGTLAAGPAPGGGFVVRARLGERAVMA